MLGDIKGKIIKVVSKGKGMGVNGKNLRKNKQTQTANDRWVFLTEERLVYGVETNNIRR